MAQTVEELESGERIVPSGEVVELFQRAGECLGVAVESTRRFTRHLGYKAEGIKKEKPLQFLAVLAGVSVAAGFAMRLWRSSRNA